MTGVRSITQRRHGSPSPVADASGPSALAAASAKWAHLQEQVASLPWSQVPHDMLADFVRAMALDTQALYGPQGACQKGLELLGVLTAPALSATPAHLHAAWSASPARLDLELLIEPESTHSRPDVAVEMDVPPGTDEEGVRQALEQWASAPATPRLVFDPVARLPGSDLAVLCRQVEDLLASASQKPDGLDAPMVAAAVLLWWQRMEINNAADGEVTLAGLHLGGADVCPGRQVVLRARRTALDTALAPATDGEPAPSVPAKIGWRRPS